MKSMWLGLVLAVVLPGCASTSKPAAPEAAAPAFKTDPAAAKQAIASGALVIDVRSPDEFAEGHLAGAINLPVQELASRLNEVDQLVAGDHAKQIVVYCGSGERADKARLVLDAKGYTGVINGGGLADLE